METQSSQNIKTPLLLLLLLCSFSITLAQVGIGNLDPKTQLDVNGALSLRAGSDLILGNGTNNNIDLGTTPYSYYRITGPSTAYNIRGIIPSTGADGQLMTLQNSSGQQMTIRHDSGGVVENRIFCPNSRDLILSSGIATVTLSYSAADSRWIVLSYSEPTSNIDSTSLAADVTITSTFPTYSDVTGVAVTFTAKSSSVMVMLTASGFGFTGSQSIVYLRVNNTTTGTSLGGTMNKIQNLDTFFVPGPPGPDGYFQNTTTTWSASFSKLVTGLTVGTTYTFQAQGAVLGIVGTPTAVIQAATTPDAEHLTLSVMQ